MRHGAILKGCAGYLGFKLEGDCQSFLADDCFVAAPVLSHCFANRIHSERSATRGDHLDGPAKNLFAPPIIRRSDGVASKLSRRSIEKR